MVLSGVQCRSINQSTRDCVGRRYTTRPGAPTVVRYKHVQTVMSCRQRKLGWRINVKPLMSSLLRV